MAVMEPSVLTMWTAGLLRALMLAGVDGEALALEAGMPAETLHDPGLRVPVTVAAQVWKAAVAKTGDPCIGIAAASHVFPGHPLGYAMLTSPTLQVALERAARYSTIASDRAEVKAGPLPGGYGLTIALVEIDEPTAEEALDMTVATIVHLARVMLGPLVSPVRVELERAEPSPRAAFDDHFGCPVAFGAGQNLLVFDLDTVQRPVPGTNDETARSSEDAVAACLAEIVGQSPLQQVRSALAALLPAGEPTLRAVAAVLHTSPRSLQRQLEAEGTSFRAELRALRYELAQDYLRDPRHSLAQVSSLLGFADTAAFQRAFKQWSGTSPGRYRARA